MADQERIALFVDGANLYASAKSRGRGQREAINSGGVVLRLNIIILMLNLNIRKLLDTRVAHTTQSRSNRW